MPGGGWSTFTFPARSNISSSNYLHNPWRQHSAGSQTTCASDTNFYLTNASAADSTTFALQYADANFPDHVTSITTSYGATVSFGYLIYNDGYENIEGMTNITDAAGIPSQFTYWNIV